MLGDCLCRCHGLAIASQICSEEPSVRLSWEVTVWVGSGLILSLASNVHSCACKLERDTHTHPRLEHSLGKDQRPIAEFKWSSWVWEEGVGVGPWRGWSGQLRAVVSARRASMQ